MTHLRTQRHASAIREMLEKAFFQAASTKEAHGVLTALALPPVGGTGAQLAQALRRDYDLLG